MSHLVVRVGTPWRLPVVIDRVVEPATIPIGVTATCKGCGGSVSATNCAETPTHCYWCANPELARLVGINRRSAVAA